MTEEEFTIYMNGMQECLTVLEDEMMYKSVNLIQQAMEVRKAEHRGESAPRKVKRKSIPELQREWQTDPSAQSLAYQQYSPEIFHQAILNQADYSSMVNSIQNTQSIIRNYSYLQAGLNQVAGGQSNTALGATSYVAGGMTGRAVNHVVVNEIHDAPGESGETPSPVRVRYDSIGRYTCYTNMSGDVQEVTLPNGRPWMLAGFEVFNISDRRLADDRYVSEDAVEQPPEAYPFTGSVVSFQITDNSESPDLNAAYDRLDAIEVAAETFAGGPIAENYDSFQAAYRNAPSWIQEEDSILMPICVARYPGNLRAARTARSKVVRAISTCRTKDAFLERLQQIHARGQVTQELVHEFRTALRERELNIPF